MVTITKDFKDLDTLQSELKEAQQAFYKHQPHFHNSLATYKSSTSDNLIENHKNYIEQTVINDELAVKLSNLEAGITTVRDRLILAHYSK